MLLTILLSFQPGFQMLFCVTRHCIIQTGTMGTASWHVSKDTASQLIKTKLPITITACLFKGLS